MFSIAMILIIVFALMVQSLVIVQRIAVADQLSGHVEVQRGAKGTFAALAQDGLIKTGDVVRTGSDGTVDFKWTDGTRWKLMENSTITVKKASFNVIKKAEQSQLDLTAGKVFIRIMKALAPSSKFEVETPTAVAAVRGTIFSVEVKGGKTTVSVFKGHVQVTNSGKSDSQKLIEPGQEAIATDPNSMQTAADTDAAAEFASQPTIVKPELVANAKLSKDGTEAIVSGSTEVGDTVTVNGKSIRVMGNGLFNKRLTLKPGANDFTIVSTDKHGESTTVTRTVTVPGGAYAPAVSPPAESPAAAAAAATPTSAAPLTNATAAAAPAALSNAAPAAAAAPAAVASTGK
jgi:hypothetical protein